MPMIYHLFANRANIGDWLSAKAIQHLLPSEQIEEYLCDAPFVDQTMKRLSRATPDDRIIIGGGGLFMDYFTPFWKRFHAASTETPFCIWGLGCCDWKREPSLAPKTLLAEIIERSRLCVVRDQLTRDYFAASSLPEPVPCPSLVVIDKSGEAGSGILHVDNFTIAGETVYHAMDDYAREFAKRTGRPYRQTNNRIEAGSETVLAAILQRYREADIVLSSALHGCIIAVAMGKKIIAVSGDRKIEGFMQAAGLSDWVLDIEQVNRLPSLFQNLAGQPSTAKFTASARKQNRAVAAEIRSKFIAGGT
jgi:polysaccharide pyruvyl transferase WcaK-like protein